MKKKTLMITAAAVVVVAAISGIVWYFASIEKPEEVLTAYMKNVDTGKYEAMYEMLDIQSKKDISKKAFVTRNKNIYEGIEAKDLKIEVEEVDRENDTVAYLSTMQTAAGRIGFENSATFYREGRQWKLRWQDSLIYPNLEKTDKVLVKSLEAERGSIYDRKGNTLAGSGTAFSIGLIPEEMDDTTDIKKLAEGLGMKAEAIEKKLSASWVKDGVFVPLKDVKNLDSIRKETLRIEGVSVNNTESRVYPLDKQAAHLVGYVQDISQEELEKLEKEGYSAQSVIGKSGLEKVFEKELHGKRGCKIYIMKASGVEKKTIALVEPENGKDIKTTIDSTIQKRVYEEFKKDKSCSVAMNPKTGEVLALVSTPSFNSSDFVLGMTQQQWDSLNNNENSPLYNRFRSLWSPGSSIKPVVGAIGISTEKLDPNDNFGYTGRSWQKDKSWGKYKITTLHTYGKEVNLRNALIHSDNIYFAKVALRMGADTLTSELEKVGFGQELPFTLAMKQSQVASNGKIEEEIQLADSGYGQGQMLVNPLHMASMYSAFVNQGNMIQPYLEYQKQPEPEFWIKNAFSKEAASIINKDMIQIVKNPKGTAHGTYMEGVKLAGKTGTAEIKTSKEDTSGTELGWLNVIYENKKNPLVLVTMVEDVKQRGGSTYVVKKEKKILKDLMKK